MLFQSHVVIYLPSNSSALQLAGTFDHLFSHGEMGVIHRTHNSSTTLSVHATCIFACQMHPIRRSPSSRWKNLRHGTFQCYRRRGVKKQVCLFMRFAVIRSVPHRASKGALKSPRLSHCWRSKILRILMLVFHHLRSE